MTAHPHAPPVPYSDDRAIRRIGFAIVVLAFGGFGAWAALAPLDSAALAPGVIAVENYRKSVQHLEGGIVRTLPVRDGDNVAKDQILATLDDTQPRAQLEVLRGQYIIAATREARLAAQRDGLAQVRYPEELTARVDDPRIDDAIRVQNQTFAVRKSAYEGEISLYQGQIEQLRARAAGLQAQKSSRESLVASYRGELADFSSLLAEGYTDKQKVRELQRNLAQSEGQQGELVADIAGTELEIGGTRLKILQLNKDLQREVAKELSEVQAALFDLREKIQSLEATVLRTVVRAPDAGMVMGLAVHTLGAVIPPGGRLLDIVPQHEKLVVEANISPLDIDRVKVGQLAEIRFSAFKAGDTPKIEGRLIGLSADRLLDEKRDNPSPYYLARVEVTDEGLDELKRLNLVLVPGMPAEVLIKAGERTLVQYLSRPLLDGIARSFIED